MHIHASGSTADGAGQVRTALAELGRASSATMSALNRLHTAALAEGALSAKVKELMAVSIAVVTGCDGCVAFHLDAAAKVGATREEAIEALDVAVLMGGGPGSVRAAAAWPLVLSLPTAEPNPV